MLPRRSLLAYGGRCEAVATCDAPDSALVRLRPPAYDIDATTLSREQHQCHNVVVAAEQFLRLGELGRGGRVNAAAPIKRSRRGLKGLRGVEVAEVPGNAAVVFT